MAHIIDTANDYRALLDAIDTFLTTNSALVTAGQAWTRLAKISTPAAGGRDAFDRYVWRGPGLAGEDQVYVMAYTYGVAASDYYNLCIQGGTFYDTTLDRLNNPSSVVTLFASSRPTPYWLSGSGRCFRLACQVDGYYSSGYAGLALPVAPPLEYPYPLVVAGSYGSYQRRYSTANFSSVADPTTGDTATVGAGGQSMWLLYPDQSWNDFYGSSYTTQASATAQTRYVLPTGNVRYSNTSFGLDMQHGTPLGSWTLQRVSLCDDSSNHFGTKAWLDGVYAIGGFNRQPEDTITVDGKLHVVFRNGSKATPTDFYALEMD